MKINKITPRSTKYPTLLQEISAKPKNLYYLGELPKGESCIAIVGSRKITKYGQAVTHKLSFDLASCGITIVSGLALGVDAVAHEAALEAGGKTIAVMACGLDTIYPATNRNLAKRVLATGGCIISEYESGTPPLRQHFPARNRIISGLSLAVVVAEAAERSGSLITASFALDQNRSVLAIPGDITRSTSAGTNNLIKSGAAPVTDAQDVLATLGLVAPELEAKTASAASREEALVLELIAQGINDSEDLIKHGDFSASQFNQVITLMEISGKVRNLGGGKWVNR